MNFRIALLFCTLALASISTAAATAGNVPPIAPADLSEGEFQSLVEKTNMYVKALNAVESAQRSYDRYASWLEVKKGPTGKERYISYGLYEISSGSVDAVKKAAQKGPRLSPALPELDAVVVRLANNMMALEPLVKKAHDYYEQEDFKDDDTRLGKELHAAMMPLFEKTFAAERELRRGLDGVKLQVDRRQLAMIEKTSGRKYEWHLRSYLLAAKSLINLLPENAEAPTLKSEDYQPRFTDLEEAYNALENYVAENPEEVKTVMLASLVETTVKDFFTASKFLRRTLEAKRLDRREYFTRVGEVAKTYNDLIGRSNST
ncbi:MAG: DUF3829 domain-containing protein [Chthoniobacterales bacterium]